ncbi:PREDICTED: probable pseudouridine-5'-phosphatase isoform X2 [Nicrophorus vespilloides]|uniref:Probable pseudouridine-5'-phosphatase isoform X2 n=1 Tax=Nicrophorus vespilloides TaxID=110193 RepID=A0ABM1M8J2_NICVS|nr:PREDICTED: probable pseudouridine-5'-phosphatase isoform X2 [Nicrophorus vespilloides]
MSRVTNNAKAGFKKVSHVIFDMDGLLLDSECLYTEASVNVLNQFNKTFTHEMKISVMGMTGRESAKFLIKHLELSVPVEEFMRLMNIEYQHIMPNAKLMPGAEQLVKHLHKNNIPIAVATSSCKESFDLKTQNHKHFFNLFHHTVTGGSDPEVGSGKPSPDIFLVCASRFPDKPKPYDCLVLEDAPNGVTAAVSAGMQCVMVPDKETSPEKCQHATLILPSLTDLKPELFGLPAIK